MERNAPRAAAALLVAAVFLAGAVAAARPEGDGQGVDLVVPLQDAPPRLRFHAGGVDRNGQPALLPELPAIPGPASPWYVAQWQQDSLLLPGAVRATPDGWRVVAPDGHSSVSIDRQGAGYAYTLSERNGELTGGGGANLFLTTAIDRAPADFGTPVRLRLRARVTAASVTYGNATAEASGAVQAMAFVGLGLMFHDPAGTEADRFVFMQVPLVVSRPTPPGPGIVCSLANGVPSLLYVPDLRPEPFRVQGQAAEHEWYLSGFVRGMLARPYRCGGRVLEWPGAQRDAAHWRLGGIYVGLEVQNRDRRPGAAGGGAPQGQATLGLDISGLSVRRQT